MRTVLLAWELGLNLGHVRRLESLAEALMARGCRVVISAREPTVASTMACQWTVKPAPKTPARPDRDPSKAPQYNYADLLRGLGYDDPAALSAAVQPWLDQIREIKPDCLITDHAPTAMLAARLAGLPACPIGVGFHVPPLSRPMPPFKWWRPSPPRVRLREVERAVLSSINQLLADHQKPALDSVSALLAGPQRFLTTLPELDEYPERPQGEHYAGFPLSPGTGYWPDWPAGDGPKILGYLRADYPAVDTVLQSLTALPVRALVYVGGSTAAQCKSWTSERVRIVDQPLDLERGAEHCDIGLNYASNAFVAQLLRAGKPLLLLPPFDQQMMLAQRLVQQRCGRLINPAWTSEQWSTVLQEMQEDTPWQQGAQRQAQIMSEYPDGVAIMAGIADEICGLM